MAKAIPLMIQGTSSDAGKSVLVTAFCRIFAQDGYKTAPFKSQNMSNNSYITIDGKEIGRAQGVQAEAAGVVATTDMNPVLIKPTGATHSQIVVHGEPFRNMSGAGYRRDFFEIGLSIIREAYERLAHTHERVVIEGAGSPAEINLNDRELVNMRVAKIANAPVILVADIERGGVFASLVGTLQLLDPADRERVIGVIINKFHGDPSLLQSGLDWFEQYTGKPVLGVVPYLPNLNIEAEDSLILNQYQYQQAHLQVQSERFHRSEKSSKRNSESSPASGLDRNSVTKELDIAVIRYPYISNFTDADPLFLEPDCQVRFVSTPEELGNPDLLLLPGSKNTIEDLLFVRNTGLEKRILTLSETGRTMVFGICGGYQMLGKAIYDPQHVESGHGEMQAIGLLPLETTLETKKTTTLSRGTVYFAGKQLPVHGYEIHMGQTTRTADIPYLIRNSDQSIDGAYDPQKRVLGTYFHGILHNDEFRKLVLNELRKAKGLAPISERISFHSVRDQAFDRLAEHIRKHVQIDRIHQIMMQFQKND